MVQTLHGEMKIPGDANSATPGAAAAVEFLTLHLGHLSKADHPAIQQWIRTLQVSPAF
jgi:hypothetical protein